MKYIIKHLSIFLISIITISLNAQVTIGSLEPSAKASLLQIKEKEIVDPKAFLS